MAKRKHNIVDLVGRDPGCGRVAFRTGTIPSRKNKQAKRNSKEGKKAHRKAIEGE